MDREQLLRSLMAHRRRVTRLHLALNRYSDRLTPETQDMIERTIATTERLIRLLETGLDPPQS